MALLVKPNRGLGMEGGVARWYNRLARQENAGCEKLADRLASLPLPGANVLEVAPGPGFLSIALARRGLFVQAVDISDTFLKIARSNAAEQGVQVDFQFGDAAVLPIESASVDLVVCQAAFKNFAHPVAALREMKRVLRPCGMALLIDLRREAPASEVRDFVNGLDTGKLNRWLVRLIFRTMLLRRAYRMEDVRQMARQADWQEPHISISSIGFECWLAA